MKRHADRQGDDQRRYEDVAEAREAACVGCMGDGGDGRADRGAGGGFPEILRSPEASDVEDDVASHQ